MCVEAQLGVGSVKGRGVGVYLVKVTLGQSLRQRPLGFESGCRPEFRLSLHPLTPFHTLGLLLPDTLR